ncbi:MAG: hypothetical protein JEY91_09515 [Spirochaetaceae bacterium]|nr:hypothetical protein [Spirochaetaceae bacterium]
MSRFVRNTLAALIISLCTLPVFSGDIESLEFHNQEITDILLVLGEAGNISIVPDETVKGTASYYFSNMDFETALSLFLSSYNYHYRLENEVYYVSRIDISINPDTDLISINAEDTDIQMIIRALSRNIGKTILFDALPRETITIHTEDLAIEDILGIVIKKYTDYSLETEDGFYYIRKEMPVSSGSRSAARSNLFTEENGLFSSSFQQIRYKEALESLFKLTGKEYSFLGRNDSVIEKFDFSQKPFEQILRLLLEQGNGDYKIIDDIYYIIDMERRDILKKFYTTVYLPLKYTTTTEIQALIPSSIASSQNLKVDKTGNAFILSGTLEEVSPIQDFIISIDTPHGEMTYHRFQLSSTDASSITGILPKELQFSTPIILKESNSFIMLLPESMVDSVREYLDLIDVDSNGYAIELKYIKAEHILENPPPSVKKEELVPTNNPNILYFKGSENRYRNFLKDLDLLDRPIPQIRYEVLVMQVQESNKFDWNFNASNALSEEDSSTSFLGELGNLLDLSFDIVSQFGYQFAFKMNLSLSNSESKIMADTSLNALSGESTHFQNTETYRYREPETDDDTNKTTPTGVSREITSGLIVEIEGWSSGDGMITMDVKTTISKRDESGSSEPGALPGTTERNVTTHIRTESGKPVIIGGLMQQDKVIGTKKTPFLGDIPLLGYLFRSENEYFQNTEMIVTIVPYLEYPEYSVSDVDRDIEALYNSFIRR